MMTSGSSGGKGGEVRWRSSSEGKGRDRRLRKNSGGKGGEGGLGRHTFGLFGRWYTGQTGSWIKIGYYTLHFWVYPEVLQQLRFLQLSHISAC